MQLQKLKDAIENYNPAHAEGELKGTGDPKLP